MDETRCNHRGCSHQWWSRDCRGPQWGALMCVHSGWKIFNLKEEKADIRAKSTIVGWKDVGRRQPTWNQRTMLVDFNIVFTIPFCLMQWTLAVGNMLGLFRVSDVSYIHGCLTQCRPEREFQSFTLFPDVPRIGIHYSESPLQWQPTFRDYWWYMVILVGANPVQR